ncbi:MAG TPA: YdcF family protein [Acidobacteriaceae bacterium]|nr:YdcF family protein [Acidobacteriaceae bacterium]
MGMQFAALRRALIVVFILTLGCSAHAQVAVRPLPMHNPLQDKNFYLFSVLGQNSEIRNALTGDPALASIAAYRRRNVDQALRLCKSNADCELKTLFWTDEEINHVSGALFSLDRNNPQFRRQVDRELRSSGAYVLDEKQSPAVLLDDAWEICARGVDDILSVYGQGAAPRYPLIDSSSFDVNSPEFQQRLDALVRTVDAASSPSQLFFDPSLSAALRLLEMNHRDEAGRLEPMQAGVNAAAVRAIRSTIWKKYPYSVIIVPGAGPGDRITPLSKAGRNRCALAAEAYHAGKAPFVLVSGGFVHPSQTRFSEALEMKKALLDEFNVPESAILVDPHARHTTTNMRNAAREIFRYGMPMDKPALVVSDSAQIGYIASQSLADRCMRELGYMPYRIASRPSDTSLVVAPSIDSLEQDPMDPLDP